MIEIGEVEAVALEEIGVTTGGEIRERRKVGRPVNTIQASEVVSVSNIYNLRDG